MQNLLSVLPESHTTGSTNCKTALLYCPNLTLRAVQIAKRSLYTAQIAHPEQCHRRKRSNTLPFHSRPPILEQCHNQNSPHALPKSHTPGSATGESTLRHCHFTAVLQFSGSVETKTIPQHCPISPTPQHKGSASAQ